jgi:hypothetical protein
MIYLPPKNWKELQENVNKIFLEIGMISEKEKTMVTPRGKIELDVFAIDPFSIDKIKYVVECKNWENAIPQTVIHSFTTVMNETGGNIGYIISKSGFQKGAFEFTNFTNIRLLTFEEFQFIYAPVWAKTHFSKVIFELSTDFLVWTSNINQKRSNYTYYDQEENALKMYDVLLKHKGLRDIIYFIINFYDSPKNFYYEPHLSKNLPPHLNHIKQLLNDKCKFISNSNTYTELITELEYLMNLAVEELNSIYGMNISK